MTIDEYADLSQRNSPELLFDLMGFGRPAGPFEQFRADYLGSSFGPSLRLVADAIGLPLDSVEAERGAGDGQTQDDDRRGHLGSGKCCCTTDHHLRHPRGPATDPVSGHVVLHDGRWIPRWEVRETGWHVSVDGDAPLEVTLRMPIPLDRMAAVSPAYTANRAVNAVPYVCEAAPGIQSTMNLPQIVTTLDEKPILVSRELNLPEMSLLLTPARRRCQSCETNRRHMSYETLVQREATP